MEETRITLDIIEQDKIWITRDGQTLCVEDMGLIHKKNVLRMLRSHAARLNMWQFTRYFGGDGPNGEVAQSCFEREMDTFIHQDLDEWFAEQPLVRRLRTLIDDDNARERRLALTLARVSAPTTAGPVVQPRGLRRA